METENRCTVLLVPYGQFTGHDSQSLQSEAAPAAKSEGCQPNHFRLGLGLGYGLGRM